MLYWFRYLSHMKLTAQIILTIGGGVVISILLSFLLWGKNASYDGLRVSYQRITSLFEDRSANYQSVNTTKQSVLGANDASYNNIEHQVSEKIKFTKLQSPFVVPTDGIAAHPNFLFDPVNHAGIDIWTSTSGKGLNNSSKGSPVYAACAGYVSHIHYPNQEIEIVCDPIDPAYAGIVPALKVKTLYAHLGDAVTKQAYHQLRLGQKVKQGELIGYQGNQSSIAPWNRVTHLHFGVYNLEKGGIPHALDPESYIGVATKQVGQIFKSNR